MDMGKVVAALAVIVFTLIAIAAVGPIVGLAAGVVFIIIAIAILS